VLVPWVSLHSWHVRRVTATFKGKDPTTISTLLPKFDLLFGACNHAADAAQIITAEALKR